MSDPLLKPYDVLQIRRPRTDNKLSVWQDFSTLRTEEDFAAARRVVSDGWQDAPGAEFRVYRSSPVDGPVLVKPEPVVTKKRRIRIKWGYEMDVVIEDGNAMEFVDDVLPLVELNSLLNDQIMRTDANRPHCTEVFETTDLGAATDDAEVQYDAKTVERWREYQTKREG